MKFIVFNIVVAVALIYLVANKDIGFDVSVPKLAKVTAAADQILDRTPAEATQTRAAAAAPKPANPFSLVSLSEVVAAPPAPFVDAPVIDDADLAISNAGTLAAVTPTPRDPAVARRRAEVLGAGPGTPPDLRPVADRRRQLLDLAEEMEYLAAEFSVR